MTEQVERERMEHKGELVTVIERGPRKTTVRTATGYIRQVPTRELDKLSAGDERKAFTIVTE
jgi:hypothetical protein